MRSSAALFYLLSIPTEARTILLYCAKVSLFVCAPVGLKSDRSVLFNLVHKCKLAAVWMNKRLGLSFFFLSFFLFFCKLEHRCKVRCGVFLSVLSLWIRV